MFLCCRNSLSIRGLSELQFCVETPGYIIDILSRKLLVIKSSGYKQNDCCEEKLTVDVGS